ncbi:Ovule protein [Pseudomonas brassicacearum]
MAPELTSSTISIFEQLNFRMTIQRFKQSSCAYNWRRRMDMDIQICVMTETSRQHYDVVGLCQFRI